MTGMGSVAGMGLGLAVGGKRGWMGWVGGVPMDFLHFGQTSCSEVSFCSVVRPLRSLVVDIDEYGGIWILLDALMTNFADYSSDVHDADAEKEWAIIRCRPIFAPYACNLCVLERSSLLSSVA